MVIKCHIKSLGCKIALAALSMLLMIGISAALASADDDISAPLFTLKSTSGQLHHLSHLRNDTLSILYFVNAEAHHTPAFLSTMSTLRRKHPEAVFTLWGICNNPEADVTRWAHKHGIEVPVLVDDGRVSELYNTALVLPALVVIGPDLEIHDTLQGTQASLPDALSLVARRLAQRGFGEAALWLSEKVLASYPKAFEAQHLKASLLLRSGKYNQAERIFYELSRRADEQQAIRGKEGLAAVYAVGSEYERALELTAQIAKQAKKRAAAALLEGDIHLQRGELSAAGKKYKLALRKKQISRLEQAHAANQLGRIAMVADTAKRAEAYFQEAMASEPLYTTARYNLGLLYRSAGDWTRALETFERLKVLEPASTCAAALADYAVEVVALRADSEARRKMAARVGALAEQMTTGPWKWVAAEDDWTSTSLKLALIEPLETMGLSERAGYPLVTHRMLTQRLINSGRVNLVNPILLTQLLHELEAKPEVVNTTAFATKLGRVLGARMVGLGDFSHGVGASMLIYRLFDTRLGEEVGRMEMPITSQYDLVAKAALLADKILETAVKRTPLQAYVVEVKGDRALLNLGAGQGVTEGRFFDAIEAQLFVEYKGKTLYPKPIRFARLEVVQVETDFCFARIVSQERPIKRNDKVLEDISDLMVIPDTQ